MSTTQTTEKAEAHSAEQSAKFTPGPWRVNENGNSPMSQITVESDELEIIVATCGFTQNRIARTNARLIAAAPELLEALKTWQKFWGTMPKGQMGKLVFDVGLLNDGFIQMDRAVSKAEKGAQ